jgi:hypothetical protein
VNIKMVSGWLRLRTSGQLPSADDKNASATQHHDGAVEEAFRLW